MLGNVIEEDLVVGGIGQRVILLETVRQIFIVLEVILLKGVPGLIRGDITVILHLRSGLDRVPDGIHLFLTDPIHEENSDCHALLRLLDHL